ncbi:phosphatase 1 regulatory subunit 1C isoform X1 [Salmo salar]|uniref:Phosphatase 1 regulatory subunit 1C isoform X1 n=1 Tax=Salmo salar TaxID=8030 RepID=A0ABM3DNB2_SALSA|nr:phosphatase 1 regulatory subunit 1C isoform X1 [Salmo salar]
MESNSPKKIQFSVPVFQSQLDPQASEHLSSAPHLNTSLSCTVPSCPIPPCPVSTKQIRKRRPTPATHVIYLPPDLTAADDKYQGEVQSAELSPAQRKHSVYSPPTMKGRESTDCCRGHSEDRDSLRPTRLPQSHTDTLALSDELSGDLTRLADTPRRKDTPYQHQPPFTPGVKLLKTTSKVSFPEEEEEKEEEEKEEEEDKQKNQSEEEHKL